jgi:hypothetical protein
MFKLIVSAVCVGAVLLAPALASATETVTYTYDARGRLVKVVQTVNSATPVTTDYTWDKADNRTHVTTS